MTFASIFSAFLIFVQANGKQYMHISARKVARTCFHLSSRGLLTAAFFCVHAGGCSQLLSFMFTRLIQICAGNSPVAANYLLQLMCELSRSVCAARHKYQACTSCADESSTSAFLIACLYAGHLASTVTTVIGYMKWIGATRLVSTSIGFNRD